MFVTLMSLPKTQAVYYGSQASRWSLLNLHWPTLPHICAEWGASITYELGVGLNKKEKEKASCVEQLMATDYGAQLWHRALCVSKIRKDTDFLPLFLICFALIIVWEKCTYVLALVRRSEGNFQELALSFHPVDSGDRTQIVRLGGNLSHLNNPSLNHFTRVRQRHSPVHRRCAPAEAGAVLIEHGWRLTHLRVRVGLGVLLEKLRYLVPCKTLGKKERTLRNPDPTQNSHKVRSV